MKAVEMKRKNCITEFEVISHRIDEEFFAGMNVVSIHERMSDNVIERLREEGFDIVKVMNIKDELLWYDITWHKAKEGRKGVIEEIVLTD